MFFLKSSPKKPTFIFIGNSHINALAEATSKYSELPRNSIFMNLNREESLLNKSENGEVYLNKNIRKKLQAIIKNNKNPIFFSLLGGNAHNKLSLLEHPEPFYFLMPGEEVVRLANDYRGTFIPYQQMYDIMCLRSKSSLEEFDLIRAEISLPIYHLESPPPIGSDVHIKEHLDPYFEKQEGEKRLSSRDLRKRLWKLHSQVFIDYCSKNDITFIPVPASSLDAEGFLIPKGYPNNATHGNFWYGKEVIIDLIGLFHNEK